MHRLPSKTLYLGLDPGDQPCVHYPVIRIEPRPEKLLEAIGELSTYSHLLFTSQQAVAIFFEYASIGEQKVIAIGPKTAEKLKERGVVAVCPAEHTQEGLIALLETMQFEEKPSFFYPRSSIARPLLAEYLARWRTCVIDLYETHFQCLEPVPDLADFERIVFTSPSTVQGFLKIYGELPKDKELVAIGPITESALQLGEN